jgi:putative ABC transport system permease protein
MLRADENYIPALEIPIKEGRNFSSAFIADSMQSVVVNESFVKAAGWKSPIGQQVTLPDEWEGEAKMNVIGVVKDYHHHSLKTEIGPQIFVMRHYEKVFVKVEEGKFAQALAAIERVYKKQIPDSPFQFSALGDIVKREYEQERQWQQIITYAALVSLMICCLGLFGLSGIAARQRIREIGIRKVLGASVADLTGVLSKDFLKLVIVAFFIAAPVSWFFSQKWLTNFAYTIQLSWCIFFIAGVLAVLIALFTISFHTIRAALGNPVKALRTE